MKSMFPVLIMLLIVGVARAQVANESEAGMASANGNTKTQTYNYKQINSYTWRDNILRFNSRYLNAKANGVETARYFDLGLRYERRLTQDFNMFAGETYVTDKFAGIRARYISDIGGKHFYFNTERTKFFTELGYRYMKETRFDRTQVKSSYGRLYNEWEHKWNGSFSTKYWLEYLPNFSHPNDWQANTELSLSAMMNDVFSLKTGMLIRYDHLPAPGILYKTDSLFTTALVAKF
jgi:putative salt-induced outer membrane protein